MALVNGLYQGARLSQWRYTMLNGLDDYLESVVGAGRGNQVVGLTMVPSGLFDADAEEPLWETMNFTFPASLDRRKDNGYVPRNKKLLTAPYTFFRVDIGGNSKDYDFEKMVNFNPGHTFTWNFCGVASPNPELLVVPEDYDNRHRPAEYAMVFNNFPQCAFTTDSYRAWLAYQTSGGGALNYVTGAVGAASQALTGNYVGAALGVVGAYASLQQQAYKAQREDRLIGNQSGSALVGSRTLDIVFKIMSITKEYARSIDDYFDRYGYATERLKVPNRSVRPHWCYTQTRNCAVIPESEGILPGVFARQIESIYNKGITFWKSINEVGNYSLDNTV